MVEITCRDARKGTCILVDNKPYEILKFEFHKPGKGQPICILEMEDMISKQKKELRASPHKMLPVADIEKLTMQLLYFDDTAVYFLHPISFETFPIYKQNLPHNILLWLEPEQSYIVTLLNNNIVSVDLPTFINTTVIDSEPGIRGNTVSGKVNKPATISQKISIMVPIFIDVSDIITVDTRTNSYVSKAKEL